MVVCFFFNKKMRLPIKYCLKDIKHILLFYDIISIYHFSLLYLIYIYTNSNSAAFSSSFTLCSHNCATFSIFFNVYRQLFQCESREFVIPSLINANQMLQQNVSIQITQTPFFAKNKPPFGRPA